MRAKYIEVGKTGGQALLEQTTPAERREIASFLARPPYPGPDIRVKLVDVEKALQHSFACTLPELLAAFFPDQPLITRQTLRATRENQQAAFRAKLQSITGDLPADSRGRSWLAQARHGQEWLFARYKNATVVEQEQQLQLIRYLASALDQLPGPDAPQRLALFAQKTSGDPHTLDPDRPAGRLLLLALNDLAWQNQHETQDTSPQNRSQEIQLYTEAGLLIDTISSNVAVYNLTGATFRAGKIDPWAQAAGKRVLLLPLRQVLAWENVEPASANIYIFENPQVFEEVIAAVEDNPSAPTLVCTSGWPGFAALSLLDKLLAQSPANTLYYSGDFDIKGLQIAAHMLARHPTRCHPWHYDPQAYSVALQSGGLPAHENELSALAALPPVFNDLVQAMQHHKTWAYQEGIASLLASDVK